MRSRYLLLSCLFILVFLGCLCGSPTKTLEKATQAEAEGRYTEALEFYEQVITEWPDSPEAGEAKEALDGEIWFKPDAEMATYDPSGFVERCKEGKSAAACSIASGIYLLVKDDCKGSIDLEVKGCELGRGESCAQAAHGILRMECPSSTRTDQEGLSFAERGCDLGDGWACFFAAEMRFTYDIVKKDYDRIDELLVKGCTLGNKHACTARTNGRFMPYEPSPQCANKAECIRTGFCTYKGGECTVGEDADCEQSEICKKTGACRALPSSIGVMCQAGSNEDCRQSEDCRAKGHCVEEDGWCVDDGARDEARQEVVGRVRDLLHGLATACEETKSNSRAVLRERFSDPDEIWGDPFASPAYSDFIQPILGYRTETLSFFQNVEAQIKSNRDLLGSGCYSKLIDAAERARKKCFFDGTRQDPSWLLTVGAADCG